MARKILYSPLDLRSAQEHPGCITVDCRFDLGDTAAGFDAYLDSHLPGAIYANLDLDLSGPVTSESGRHPLPSASRFAAFLARSGWSPGKLLVAYDDAGGSIAARLWWLMKYYGHDCAALLDGGIDAWQQAGFGTENGQPEVVASSAVLLEPDNDLVLSTRAVSEGLRTQDIVLADARAAERFLGQEESIDPVAGHIPGAVNYPLTLNLTANEYFKPLEDIRAGLQALLGTHRSRDLVHMCGSGVTACLNLFAAELAGLADSKLYVGSWSEWIRDPSRPIEGQD